MRKKERRAEQELKAPARVTVEGGLPAWAGLALGAMAVLAYLPALNGPFLFDDLNLPMLGADANSPWILYVRRGLRAITYLSLAVDKAVFGLNPLPYHVENLLLHMANGWLVFRILGKLLERAGQEKAARGWAAGFGAAVFLLHPLQTEGVAYIASRSEVLCGLFAYAACLAFLSLKEGDGAGWPRTIGILLLLGLGAVSKEPAVAMAGVLLLADLWFGEKLNWMAAARNWRLFGALTVAGIAGAGQLYEIASREGTAGATAAVTRWDYLFTQFKVVWRYVGMVALPVGQNLDHAYPATKAPGDLLAWVGLAGLAAVVAGAFVWRRRYPVATLGALMFLVLLTPTSSIVPIDDTMAERRVYLGFVGLAAIAADGVSRMKRDPARMAGLGVVLAVLTAATAARSSDYGSGEAMWTSSVKANPANGRARFQLGYAYYTDGRCREAAAEYGESARYGKTDYRLLVDWALALECSGDSETALQKLRQATTLEQHSHAWSVMGMVLGKRKKPDQALEALSKALELNPRDDTALLYRGNVYLMQGEREKALQDYESALRINPSNDGAQQGRRAAQ